MTITLAAVLIVGSLARPDQASAGYQDALRAAHRCQTETSWAEHRGNVWVPVCGDADGNPVLEANSLQELANLRYAMAESAGLDADSAYEDTFGER